MSKAGETTLFRGTRKSRIVLPASVSDESIREIEKDRRRKRRQKNRARARRRALMRNRLPHGRTR